MGRSGSEREGTTYEEHVRRHGQPFTNHEADFRAAIAKALGVPDGGRYLNDSLERIAAMRGALERIAEAAKLIRQAYMDPCRNPDDALEEAYHQAFVIRSEVAAFLPPDKPEE